MTAETKFDPAELINLKRRINSDAALKAELSFRNIDIINTLIDAYTRAEATPTAAESDVQKERDNVLYAMEMVLRDELNAVSFVAEFHHTIRQALSRAPVPPVSQSTKVDAPGDVQAAMEWLEGQILILEAKLATHDYIPNSSEKPSIIARLSHWKVIRTALQRAGNVDKLADALRDVRSFVLATSRGGIKRSQHFLDIIDKALAAHDAGKE